MHFHAPYLGPGFRAWRWEGGWKVRHEPSGVVLVGIDLEQLQFRCDAVAIWWIGDKTSRWPRVKDRDMYGVSQKPGGRLPRSRYDEETG